MKKPVSKKLLATLALLGLISPLKNAQSAQDFERERLFKETDPGSLNPAQIKEDKEIFLFNESLLVEDQCGYMETSYTGLDNNRFSIGAHISSNYTDPGELSALEIQFSRQLDSFTGTWISFLAKSTKAKYEALADEIQSDNGDIRREGKDQSFTTVGLGAGYRFKLFSKAFGFERIFETADAYLTYNMHLDSSDDVKYNGFGIQTDYGIHYRAAENFFYGTKLSYSILSVQRSAEEDEKLEDRSLVFGWLSLGFELGYYY